MKPALVVGSVLLLLAAAAAGLSLAPRWGGGEEAAPPGEGVAPAVASSPALSGAAFAGFPAEAAPASILLNEVGFAPADGEAAWVELRNASDAAVRPGGFALRDAYGLAWRIPDEAPELPPDGLLLVVFDGGDGVSGGVAHVPVPDFLHPERGFVTLVDSAGAPVDRVGWGDGEPDAVALGAGGRLAAVEPGSSIGRAPASPGVAPPWAPYPPGGATPGAPNPPPEAGILLPLDGAEVVGEGIRLGWYPVPGAVGYVVQVGRDARLEPPLLDREVVRPTLEAPLAAGTYHWRVRPLFPGGVAGAFSSTRSLRLAPVGPSGAAAGLPTASFAGASTDPAPAARILDVPLIEQRKDTRMLLLESDRPDGPHAWNAPHAAGDLGDPADYRNCSLASSAMINAYLHARDRTGQRGLSQDRIGYEVHRDRIDGPEFDLNWDRPVMDVSVSRALAFAVGGSVEQKLETPRRREPPLPRFADSLWNALRREVDAGRPVLIGVPGHVVVGTGYREADGERWVSLNDPGLPAMRYAVQVELLDADSYWLVFPGRPPADEAGIHEDADGDGMVDFDETERFGTDAADPDSDGDGRPDLADVFESVFDAENGWARRYGQAGSAWSRWSRIPMELEADSDGGGCPDGEEDANGNGRRDGDESWNFDEMGEGCLSVCVPGPAARDRLRWAQVRGTITQEYAEKTVRPERVHKEVSEAWTLTAEVAGRARLSGEGGSFDLRFGGPPWSTVTWTGEGVYFDEPWSTDVRCPAQVSGGASWATSGLDAVADSGTFQVFVAPVDCPQDEVENRPELGGWYALEAVVPDRPLCGLSMSGTVDLFHSGGQASPVVLRDELRWDIALHTTEAPEFERRCRGPWLETEPGTALYEVVTAAFALAAPLAVDASVLGAMEALSRTQEAASGPILDIADAREALLRACRGLGGAWLEGDDARFDSLLRELQAADRRLTAGWDAVDAVAVDAVRPLHDAVAQVEEGRRRRGEATADLTFAIQQLLRDLESGGLATYERDPGLEPD